MTEDEYNEEDVAEQSKPIEESQSEIHEVQQKIAECRLRES